MLAWGGRSCYLNKGTLPYCLAPCSHFILVGFASTVDELKGAVASIGLKRASLASASSSPPLSLGFHWCAKYT